MEKFISLNFKIVSTFLINKVEVWDKEGKLKRHLKCQRPVNFLVRAYGIVCLGGKQFDNAVSLSLRPTMDGLLVILIN